MFHKEFVFIDFSLSINQYLQFSTSLNIGPMLKINLFLKFMKICFYKTFESNDFEINIGFRNQK